MGAEEGVGEARRRVGEEGGEEEEAEVLRESQEEEVVEGEDEEDGEARLREVVGEEEGSKVGDNSLLYSLLSALLVVYSLSHTIVSSRNRQAFNSSSSWIM